MLPSSQPLRLLSLLVIPTMAVDWGNFFFRTVSHIILLFAIPVHLLTCVAIVKNKKTHFANSYFTLAVSLLLNDSIICGATAIFNLAGIKQESSTIKSPTFVTSIRAKHFSSGRNCHQWNWDNCLVGNGGLHWSNSGIESQQQLGHCHHYCESISLRMPS